MVPEKKGCSQPVTRHLSDQIHKDRGTKAHRLGEAAKGGESKIG
jgi:hypothetical protein